ncbi:hypothetical protein FHG87_006942 [Trinorchestia longiramus]|nr:hypothetical protein FHG87_006942 [Trinorchestia longiramus]
MHNGFNRQGMSFFPNQMGVMNRFQVPQGNMNRSGPSFHNPTGFGRQQQNVGGQSANFVRAPASVSSNGGNSGVQSRLGPRTAITAPGKNEGPASSNRPVLRRPGSQDKDNKNLKPEDKAQTVEEKKSTSGNKNEGDRATTTAGAGSNKNEHKPPTTTTPDKTTGKDAVVGDLPSMSAPKYGSSASARQFPASKQNSPSKPPPQKVDSEPSSGTSKFASNSSGIATNVSSPNRFNTGANTSTKSAPGEGDHPKPGPLHERSSGAPSGRYNPSRSSPAASSEPQQSRQFEQKSGSDPFPNRHAVPHQAGQPGNKNTSATGNSDRYPGRFDAGNSEQDGKFGHQRPSRFNANPNASNANGSNQQSRDRSFDRNANDDAGGHRVRQGPGSHGSTHWSSASPAAAAPASANKEPPRRGGDMNRSRGGFSQVRRDTPV